MYIIEQGQLLAILIIIVAICAIMTIYHFYLRFKSSTYSKDAKRALEELENLSLPIRFFTNEELVNYQNSKQELEKNIKSLYSSHFISDNLLDKKELRTFLIKLSGELTSIDFPKMPPMAKCEDDPKADLPF